MDWSKSRKTSRQAEQAVSFFVQAQRSEKVNPVYWFLEMDKNQPSGFLEITPHIMVAQIMERYPETISVFLRHHMSCVGCSLSAFDTLADAALVHDIPLDLLIHDLTRAVQQSPLSHSP
uniref:DUF1858 domain-containing protein n=1 Tax=Anaerolinea thermolimosa TaxID=229919 RepID=A0A7C4PLF2_9CHLR